MNEPVRVIFAVVRRADRRGYRTVVCAETGRVLGAVGQHHGGTPHDGTWSAWSPPSEMEDDAVGDGHRGRMRDAVADLLEPRNLRPAFGRRMCRTCANTIRWRPNGGDPPCADCETAEAAEARSRAECPIAWEHYDWLCSRTGAES